MMDFTPLREPVPLETTTDGVIRVTGTRVPLDAVVEAFRVGATPEEIVWQYPTLPLRDVYSVITYYLHHQDEVETYLQEREQARRTIRIQNEKRFDSQGVRERLLARRTQQD